MDTISPANIEQAAAEGFGLVVEALVGRYAEDDNPGAEARLQVAICVAWDRLKGGYHLLNMTEQTAKEIAADLL